MVYIQFAVLFLVANHLRLAKGASVPLDMSEFNHELEAEFATMDTNNDNAVSEREMEAYVLQQDTNNDGCVTFIEFMRQRIHDSLMFSWALFDHYDYDDDDCIASFDDVMEFNAIDINPKDSVFTIAELEAYYDKLYVKMGLPMKPRNPH